MWWEEDTVSLKPIKVKTQAQGLAVITGLEEGTRVVVEGKQNLRPNAKVREAQAKPAANGAPDAKAPADNKPAADSKPATPDAKPATPDGKTPAAASQK